MKRDYSAPVTMPRSSRSSATPRTAFKTTQNGKKPPEEEKQVDYSHLDIVAEIERLTGCSLRHVSKAEYAGRCPFPGCPSMNDGFRVWDRPTLDLTRDNKREKHFWCRRCDRSGDLIALVRQYREAMTGEIITWAEAARSLGIDSRTWRAFAEGEEQPRSASTTRQEKRRQQEVQREKAGQAEVDLLGAWYTRARAWLAAGQIVLKDGRTISLDQARLYLQERGFSLDQAGTLGLAYIPTVKELPEIATIPEAATLAPWRGRLLFPLSGPKGIHGYAGRTLFLWKPGMTSEEHKHLLDGWNERKPEQRIQRYYKTYQTAHYGYEDACSVKTLMVVEGEFDAASLRLALEGEDIAIMAVGTHFQARLVPLNVSKVLLALDSDQAGQQALERQKDDLEGRGLIVEIARPPMGKDWNEYHLQAGLTAIRAALAPGQDQAQNITAQNEQYLSATSSQSNAQSEDDCANDGIPRCYVCSALIDFTDGAFAVDEDRASETWGEAFCMACWKQFTGVSSTELHQDEQIARVHAHSLAECFEDGQRPVARVATTDEYHCSKHGKPYAYSDEMGGRYCAHIDCWQRYRLIRAGAQRGYPVLTAIIDPRDHLPDTTKAPLYRNEWGIDIYPTRPVLSKMLISAGGVAWSEFVRANDYQDVDAAIRAFIG